MRSAHSIVATRMMIANGLCRLLNQSNSGIQLCEFYFFLSNLFGDVNNVGKSIIVVLRPGFSPHAMVTAKKKILFLLC
jgi:hypothetical protein